MVAVTGNALSVREISSEIPTEYFLTQNYPNPFNPSTEIRFGLKQNGHVLLTVYNIMGQEVARLVDAPMNMGTHAVTFNASDLASGIYYYSITVNDFTRMQKMALIR